MMVHLTPTSIIQLTLAHYTHILRSPGSLEIDKSYPLSTALSISNVLYNLGEEDSPLAGASCSD